MEIFTSTRLQNSSALCHACFLVFLQGTKEQVLPLHELGLHLLPRERSNLETGPDALKMSPITSRKHLPFTLVLVLVFVKSQNSREKGAGDRKKGRARKKEHTNVFRFPAGTLSIGFPELPCPLELHPFLGRMKQVHEIVTVPKSIRKGHLKLNR